MDCSSPGCDREAARGGLCWGHCKRRQRKKSLNAPLKERLRDRSFDKPWRRVLKAVTGLITVDEANDTAYDRAIGRLQYAMRRWELERPRWKQRRT